MEFDNCNCCIQHSCLLSLIKQKFLSKMCQTKSIIYHIYQIKVNIDKRIELIITKYKLANCKTTDWG